MTNETTEQKNDTLSCDADVSCAAPKGDKKKKKDNRRDKGPVEKGVLIVAWVFFFASIAISFFYPVKEGVTPPFLIAASLAGAKELLTFLYQHLVSAMVPAFFLAAPIYTLFLPVTLH